MLSSGVTGRSGGAVVSCVIGWLKRPGSARSYEQPATRHQEPRAQRGPAAICFAARASRAESRSSSLFANAMADHYSLHLQGASAHRTSDRRARDLQTFAVCTIYDGRSALTALLSGWA